MKVRRSECHAIRLGCHVLRGLGSEVSLACAAQLEKGEHAAYLDRKIDANLYDDWRDFFTDYQAVELFSKFDGLQLSVNREQVALGKFKESEEICRATNHRLSRFDQESSPWLWSVFMRAKGKIERTLGRFDWDEVETCMAFGPGAAVGIPRLRSHGYYKIGERSPTTTGENAVLAELLISSSHAWLKAMHPETPGKVGINLAIVPGSRVTTVPKNAKTDRVIAIEPLMNMFVQKGIGCVIRRALKRVGVNLNDQTRNQQLAKAGSESGQLATLDLRAASDSIARNLVELLVPSDWLLAMKICRSKSCVLPSGESILLEKFSSMGNGYTFELESLIFWALCSSVLDLLGESSRDLGVYGDDLIVPVNAVEQVVSVLSFAGFCLNETKSFWCGPFRESCGKHYFRGHDVTPFYLREKVACPERNLWAANCIRRLANRMVGMAYGCDERLLAAYRYVCEKLPRDYQRLSIPEGFGDGGLVRDFDEARPRRHRFIDAYIIRHLSRVTPKREIYDDAAYALKLLSLRARGNAHPWYLRRVRFKDLPDAVDKQGELPLALTRRRWSLRVVKTHTPQWGGLGPWLSLRSETTPI
jgi:hypothetical protein